MKEIPIQEVAFGTIVIWEEREWRVCPASEKPNETRRRLFQVGGTATVLLTQETVVVLVTSVN